MASAAHPEPIEPIQPLQPPSGRPRGGHDQHTLPAPFLPDACEPLTQGAEALVYRTHFLTPQTPAVLKYRPPKPYRHPTLDKRLTKARLLAEARVLVKCRREGVSVPAVLGADWEGGWLVLEYVGGGTVRGVLDGWVHRLPELSREGNSETISEGRKKSEEEEALWELMRKVGRAVGRLHEIGVCHGDLTTSNLMVRDEEEYTENETNLPPSGDIVLIDFGLATQTIQDEDRAVDLYVLERAFAATHPAAEPLFQEVLRTYGGSFKGAKSVLRRLEDVRLRGRKKSMLG
ncbi:kinase-like protein [Delitschia confertaspora ATCC 74209]|uniref:EKC/KEOPS complex subunit BUD32 n=1 Tax=Delitschia confertaspora ATCC 74209 TaxID=1513339 RepID=A0A9P4JR80_9PLEO|nr:kinase-like protein [Delitschia confertaspora ATCC 74209]